MASTGKAPSWTEILDALPDVTVLFRRSDLRVLDVNHQDGAHGFSRRELLRKTLSDLVPGLSPTLMEALLQRTHDPHPDTPLRMVARDRNGTTAPVDIKASHLDAKHAAATLRRVSEQARIAERELVTVICSAPEAIITWTPEGRIVSWNPGAERLYGLTAAEAIGQSINALVPSTGRKELAEAQARLLAGEQTGMAERIKLRGAQPVEVAESLFLVRDHGPHPLRVGSFSRDVSEVLRLREAARLLSGVAHLEGTTARPRHPPAMRETLENADVAARDRSAAVLLLGETGVGKSHLARRIHAQSPRASQPFLEVNCASLDPQRVESELFGHERGAFTGAAQLKRGLIEVAQGGTVFLDEVGELPLGAQAKLLSFLDAQKFRRVGGTQTLSADVRLISATNTDLAEAVAKKSFREDLFYRLRVMPIHLPTLKERREEIPAIAQQMLKDLRGHVAPALSREALSALKQHPWPGNLRELRNALERAAILSGGETLQVEHLPEELRQSEGAASDRQTLAWAERRHIQNVLAETGGNQSEAAKILGVDRSTLRRKLRP